MKKHIFIASAFFVLLGILLSGSLASASVLRQGRVLGEMASIGGCSINAFDAKQSSEASESVVTLTWDTSCASVGIENMDGFPGKNFGSSGSADAVIKETTTFTLYASNAEGCVGEATSPSTTKGCEYVTKSLSVTVKTGDLDSTPRIAYWWGKVNQHVDSEGNWRTDPDGVSGANLDKLAYCKKWYPDTTSIRDYKFESVNNTWRERGNIGGPYSIDVMTTECVKGTTQPPQARSLKILAPNGGEVFQTGQQMTIKWKSTGYGPGSIIAIDLTKRDSDGSSANTFLMSASNLADDGIETLTIPTNVPTGTNYALHMSIYDPATTLWQSARTDGTFTINNIAVSTCGSSSVPSITVLSPNGGEMYQAGQQVTVKWKSCNIPSNYQWSIFLSNAPASANYLIASNTANDGIETFTVPSREQWSSPIDVDFQYGNYFKVQVSAVNPPDNSPGHTDYSDNYFAVNAPNPNVCARNASPSITVIAPNGGESYLPGEKVLVKWKSCKMPRSTKVRLELLMSQPNGMLTRVLKTTSNDGSEKVALPSTASWPQMVYGNNFKVNIRRASNGIGQGLPQDQSDSNFTIGHTASTAMLTIAAAPPGPASGNPPAGIVQVSTTDETENVVLLEGTLSVSGSDVALDKLPITFTTVGGASVGAIADSVTLVINGDEFNESMSGSLTTQVITFDDLDRELSEGVSVPFEVRVDVNAINPGQFDEGDTLSASLTDANRNAIAAEDEDGDPLAAAQKSGTANGNPQELRSEGVILTFVSEWEQLTDGNNPNTDTGTFNIRYKIAAFGNDMYVSNLANAALSGVTIGKTTAHFDRLGTALTAGTSVSLANLTDNTLTALGLYKIEEGTQETFSLTGTAQLPAAGAAGQYRMKLGGVSWSADPNDPTPNNAYEKYLGDFKTGYLFLN